MCDGEVRINHPGVFEHPHGKPLRSNSSARIVQGALGHLQTEWLRGVVLLLMLLLLAMAMAMVVVVCGV